MLACMFHIFFSVMTYVNIYSPLRKERQIVLFYVALAMLCIIEL
jgi:hypothetical protein